MKDEWRGTREIISYRRIGMTRTDEWEGGRERGRERFSVYKKGVVYTKPTTNFQYGKIHEKRVLILLTI